MKRFSLNLFVIFMCWTSSLARHVPTGDINTYVLNETKSYMDANAEYVCEQFYDYVCKYWPKTHRNNPNVGHTWAYMYSSDLMQMLEDGITKSDKPETKEVFTKLHDFYGTCKKEKDDINVEEYYDVSKPTDEDAWPQYGETWNPTETWSLWKTLGRLAKYGFDVLLVTFDLEENPDLQTYTAKFKPYHARGRWVPINEEAENTTDKEAVAMLKKVSKFTINTSHIYQNTRYLEEVVETNIDELKQRYKNMDMYLSAYFGAETFKNIKGVQIENPQYFEQLMKLIDNTPQDVLIHVLKWTFKYYLTYVLPDKITDIACAEILRESVPLALEYVYEREVFGQQKEQKEAVIEKVFFDLQTKLARIIRTEHQDLPKEQIEDYAEKSLKMKLKFGRLPLGVDDQVYVDFFQSWDVVNDNFYLNHLNLLKRLHFDSRELLKLDKFKSFRQFVGLAESTPSYLRTSNAVVIPFAYTFNTLNDANVHELYVYADIGTSLAGAMLHGFNIEGVKYDKDGLIFDRCASDDLSACLPSNVEKGAQCILKYLNTALIRPEEHIAESSGFRVAYATYFQSAKYSKFTGDPELNDKQLFAIKFGQTFCYNRGFDYGYTRPSNRLEFIVEHSPEFNEIFSCGENETNMCKIW